MRKLTRAGAALAGAGLTLLGLGMATANVELLVASVLPLLLVATSLTEPRAAKPVAQRTLSTRAPRRGDRVESVLRIDISDRQEITEVHTALPDSFLLEQGSNVALRAGGGRLVSAFRARPQARGQHPFGPVRAERIDAAGLLGPMQDELVPVETLDVAPRLLRRARFRGRLRTRGRLAFTAAETSRLGARSTDFRELRDYAWGDPPSSIHWKATARRMSTRASRVPVVTEYELEGRRTVLVLLDGGEALRVGTTLESGLDHAVEAALTLTSFFLESGARVGAATYGARSGAPAYPESGEGQFAPLERALDPGAVDPDSTLASMLERVHGHLHGGKPFVAVITRITPETAPRLVEAARRLRGLLRETRRVLPLVVVDVRALDLAPAPTPAWEAARSLAELEDTRATAEVRAAGARVVAWRPLEEDFLQALIRRGLR